MAYILCASALHMGEGMLLPQPTPSQSEVSPPPPHFQILDPPWLGPIVIRYFDITEISAKNAMMEVLFNRGSTVLLC